MGAIQIPPSGKKQKQYTRSVEIEALKMVYIIFAVGRAT